MACFALTQQDSIYQKMAVVNMISVVVPLYNKKDSIGSTIESVLAQTYSDFELLVVDDGSTDGSAGLVSRFDDPRIRLIRKSNGGVSSARNVGIRNARGEWIAFLDGDDIWEKNFLAEIARMSHDFPEAGILGTSYVFLKNGRAESATKSLPKAYFGLIDNSSWRFGQLYWTSAVCCRKSALEEVGMFDERIAYGEDLDVWWRIMLRYPAAFSNKELAVYRFDEDNRAMNKRIPLEKLYINYFEKYSEARRANPAFRHFIDKECMWWLYPYCLENPKDENVGRILSQIDLSEYKPSFWFRFHFSRLYSLLRKR